MAGIWGGLYFLAFLVLILLVIRWCIESEKKSSGDTAPGLFAMRTPRTKTTRGRWHPRASKPGSIENKP